MSRTPKINPAWFASRLKAQAAWDDAQGKEREAAQAFFAVEDRLMTTALGAIGCFEASPGAQLLPDGEDYVIDDPWTCERYCRIKADGSVIKEAMPAHLVHRYGPPKLKIVGGRR